MLPDASVLLALLGLISIADAESVKPRNTGGKRGLAFAKGANDAVNRGRPGSYYTHYFQDHSKITWMYDWEAVVDGDAADLEYVPMLHNDQQVFTGGWADAVALAQQKYGATCVLSFNEPDQCGSGGACMDVSRAVSAHRDFLQPLAKHGLRVGSPAVTSGGESGKGLNWLRDFMATCSDCQIDFIVAHWYAWDKPEDFKAYMENMYNIFRKPIWITELGVSEGDANPFLQNILPWMDQQDWIERYAYYMVAPSTSHTQFLIDAAGTGLSSTGCIYVEA